LAQHFLEIGSMLAERAGQGGGEWVHTKGANNMAACKLSCRSRWLALGGPFLSSFAPTDLDNGLLAM